MTEPRVHPEREANDDEQSEQDELREQTDADRARALILQRRNRFIVAAIAGLGAAQSACSDSHGPDDPAPTNQQAGQGNQAGQGGRAGPNVCLSIMIPVSGTGAAGVGGSAGSRPNVCLSLPLGGTGGAGIGGTSGAGRGGTGIETCTGNQPPPCVCLSAPFDEDAGVDDGAQD